MSTDFDNPTMKRKISRTNYWIHLTILTLLCIGFFITAIRLVTLGDYGFFLVLNYAIFLLAYSWMLVLGRLGDAERTAWPWVLAILILPFINYFILVWLGFVRSKNDTQTWTLRDKIIIAICLPLFSLGYVLLLIFRTLLSDITS